MRLIKFTGIDNLEYSFPTRFTRELIGEAENMDDLPAELYFRATEIVELLPAYESYYSAINAGNEPTAQQRQKLTQFIKLVLDQLISDFLLAYPEHIIGAEYNPVTGISSDGRLSFHRLVGPMSALLNILMQMFGAEQAKPEEDKIKEKHWIGKSKGVKRKLRETRIADNTEPVTVDSQEPIKPAD
jgi:hypothetical protein